MKIRRTRLHFEQAMQNANCPLFEAIARWVIQDDGYLSMDTLVARIKNLENLERRNGIIPPPLKNRRMSNRE